MATLAQIACSILFDKRLPNGSATRMLEQLNTPFSRYVILTQNGRNGDRTQIPTAAMARGSLKWVLIRCRAYSGEQYNKIIEEVMRLAMEVGEEVFASPDFADMVEQRLGIKFVSDDYHPMPYFDVDGWRIAYENEILCPDRSQEPYAFNNIKADVYFVAVWDASREHAARLKMSAAIHSRDIWPTLTIFRDSVVVDKHHIFRNHTYQPERCGNFTVYNPRPDIAEFTALAFAQLLHGGASIRTNLSAETLSLDYVQ